MLPPNCTENTLNYCDKAIDGNKCCYTAVPQLHSMRRTRSIWRRIRNEPMWYPKTTTDCSNDINTLVFSILFNGRRKTLKKQKKGKTENPKKEKKTFSQRLQSQRTCHIPILKWSTWIWRVIWIHQLIGTWAHLNSKVSKETKNLILIGIRVLRSSGQLKRK